MGVFLNIFIAVLLQHTMLELSNITQKPQILSTDETQVKTDKLNLTILHLMNNLTHVNETLSSKLQWVADDQDKDRVSVT